MAKKFQVDDLVWAKLKGHPHWPAKVTEPPSTQKSPTSKYYVLFYGTLEYAWIPEVHLFPYKEFKEKFTKACLRKKFNEAVWQIEEDPHLTVSSTVKTPKGRIKKMGPKKEKAAASKVDSPMPHATTTGRARGSKRHMTESTGETPDSKRPVGDAEGHELGVTGESLLPEDPLGKVSNQTGESEVTGEKSLSEDSVGKVSERVGVSAEQTPPTTNATRCRTRGMGKGSGQGSGQAGKGAGGGGGGGGYVERLTRDYAARKEQALLSPTLKKRGREPSTASDERERDAGGGPKSPETEPGKFVQLTPVSAGKGARGRSTTGSKKRGGMPVATPEAKKTRPPKRGSKNYNLLPPQAYISSRTRSSLRQRSVTPLSPPTPHTPMSGGGVLKVEVQSLEGVLVKSDEEEKEEVSMPGHSTEQVELECKEPHPLPEKDTPTPHADQPEDTHEAEAINSLSSDKNSLEETTVRDVPNEPETDNQIKTSTSSTVPPSSEGPASQGKEPPVGTTTDAGVTTTASSESGIDVAASASFTPNAANLPEKPAQLDSDEVCRSDDAKAAPTEGVKATLTEGKTERQEPPVSRPTSIEGGGRGGEGIEPTQQCHVQPLPPAAPVQSLSEPDTQQQQQQQQRSPAPTLSLPGGGMVATPGLVTTPGLFQMDELPGSAAVEAALSANDHAMFELDSDIISLLNEVPDSMIWDSPIGTTPTPGLEGGGVLGEGFQPPPGVFGIEGSGVCQTSGSVGQAEAAGQQDQECPVGRVVGAVGQLVSEQGGAGENVKVVEVSENISEQVFVAANGESSVGDVAELSRPLADEGGDQQVEDKGTADVDARKVEDKGTADVDAGKVEDKGVSQETEVGGEGVGGSEEVGDKGSSEEVVGIEDEGKGEEVKTEGLSQEEVLESEKEEMTEVEDKGVLQATAAEGEVVETEAGNAEVEDKGVPQEMEVDNGEEEQEKKVEDKGLPQEMEVEGEGEGVEDKGVLQEMEVEGKEEEKRLEDKGVSQMEVREADEGTSVCVGVDTEEGLMEEKGQEVQKVIETDSEKPRDEVAQEVIATDGEKRTEEGNVKMTELEESAAKKSETEETQTKAESVAEEGEEKVDEGGTAVEEMVGGDGEDVAATGGGALKLELEGGRGEEEEEDEKKEKSEGVSVSAPPKSGRSGARGRGGPTPRRSSSRLATRHTPQAPPPSSSTASVSSQAPPTTDTLAAPVTKKRSAKVGRSAREATPSQERRSLRQRARKASSPDPREMSPTKRPRTETPPSTTTLTSDDPLPKTQKLLKIKQEMKDSEESLVSGQDSPHVETQVQEAGKRSSVADKESKRNSRRKGRSTAKGVPTTPADQDPVSTSGEKSPEEAAVVSAELAVVEGGGKEEEKEEKEEKGEGEGEGERGGRTTRSKSRSSAVRGRLAPIKEESKLAAATEKAVVSPTPPPSQDVGDDESGKVLESRKKGSKPAVVASTRKTRSSSSSAEERLTPENEEGAAAGEGRGEGGRSAVRRKPSSGSKDDVAPKSAKKTRHSKDTARDEGQALAEDTISRKGKRSSRVGEGSLPDDAIPKKAKRQTGETAPSDETASKKPKRSKDAAKMEEPPSADDLVTPKRPPRKERAASKGAPGRKPRQLRQVEGEEAGRGAGKEVASGETGSDVKQEVGVVKSDGKEHKPEGKSSSSGAGQSSAGTVSVEMESGEKTDAATAKKRSKPKGEGHEEKESKESSNEQVGVAEGRTGRRLKVEKGSKSKSDKPDRSEASGDKAVVSSGVVMAAKPPPPQVIISEEGPQKGEEERVNPTTNTKDLAPSENSVPSTVHQDFDDLGVVPMETNAEIGGGGGGDKPVEGGGGEECKENGEPNAYAKLIMDADHPPPILRIRSGMTTVEVLQTCNYNLKASLVVNTPNIRQALMTLRDLQELPCSTSDLNEVPDLIYTLRKLRRYQPNQKIRNKSDEVYARFRSMYLRPHVTVPPVARRNKTTPTMADYISKQTANKTPAKTPSRPQTGSNSSDGAKSAAATTSSVVGTVTKDMPPGPEQGATPPDAKEGGIGEVRKPSVQTLKELNTPVVPSLERMERSKGTGSKGTGTVRMKNVGLPSAGSSGKGFRASTRLAQAQVEGGQTGEVAGKQPSQPQAAAAAATAATPAPAESNQSEDQLVPS